MYCANTHILDDLTVVKSTNISQIIFSDQVMQTKEEFIKQALSEFVGKHSVEAPLRYFHASTRGSVFCINDLHFHYCESLCSSKLGMLQHAGMYFVLRIYIFYEYWSISLVKYFHFME